MADRSDFLGRLDEDQSAALRRVGLVRAYRRGAALFHERQVGDRVVVLLEGCVKLSRTTEDGREVVLAIRCEGDLLGELAVLDGAPRTATATAVDDVSALVVGAQDFLAFLYDHPGVSLLLLRMVADRLRDADAKRVEFTAHDTVGRVAARLVELAERFGEPDDGGVSITLPLTQEELAGWTGASREAVAKALQQLRDPGWIETGRRRVRIRSMDALRRRSA